MMKGLGNDNQISYIQVNIQQPCKNIRYEEEKKGLFGKIIREEGFYILKENPFYNEYVKMIEIPSYILINGKVAIEKPHIVIEYSNNREEKIYFNTDKDMNVFIKREFQGKNWRVLN